RQNTLSRFLKKRNERWPENLPVRSPSLRCKGSSPRTLLTRPNELPLTRHGINIAAGRRGRPSCEGKSRCRRGCPGFSTSAANCRNVSGRGSWPGSQLNCPRMSSLKSSPTCCCALRPKHYVNSKTNCAATSRSTRPEQEPASPICPSNEFLDLVAVVEQVHRPPGEVGQGRRRIDAEDVVDRRRDILRRVGPAAGLPPTPAG